MRYDTTMQCNIDAKGKAVRLIYGLLMIATGSVIAGLGLAGLVGGWWVWAVTGVLVLLGTFGVFEARMGWCVVRAMGIQTRW